MHFLFFFFNDTATTEIYTLSLHDALPISLARAESGGDKVPSERGANDFPSASKSRSEEHTSELQSRLHLVCRLLLEKKKKRRTASQLAQLASCVSRTIEYDVDSSANMS